MNKIKAKAIEAKILLLVKALKGLIGDKNYDQITEYVINHGEYGGALEHLLSCCEQENFHLYHGQYNEVMDLLKMMEFDTNTIAYYKETLQLKK